MKIKLLTDGGYVDKDGEPLTRFVGKVFDVIDYSQGADGEGLAGIKPPKGVREWAEIPLYFNIPEEAVIVEE